MSHLFDNVTVASGETVSATMEVERGDQNTKFYLIGDENSADVTVKFYTKPRATDSTEFFHSAGADEKNIDISDGETYTPVLRPTSEIKIEVTNNGQNSTTISGFADKYIDT